MLLVIHNLPNTIRYSDLKALIRDRCSLTDIILDNLVAENQLSRKVTVGLSDENDAAIVQKELNGLIFMGQKLFVEDLRQKKQLLSNQIYTANKILPKEQSGNQVSLKNIRGMHAAPVSISMNTHGIQYSVPDKQGTHYQFQAAVARDKNTIITHTQSMTSYNSSHGMYGNSNNAMIQNTNMTYRSQSSIGNNHRMLYDNSKEFQSDCIPFSAGKSVNDSYNKNQEGSRYFQMKDDEQYSTSNYRQGFERRARYSSDRSLQIPPVKNEYEPYETRNRSNFSKQSRFDNKNRSEDFPRRSNDGNSRFNDINKIREESRSNINEAYSRSFESNHSRDLGNNRYNENSRRQDSGYYKKSNDNNSRRFIDDSRSNCDKTSRHAATGNYNRSFDLNRGHANNKPGFDRINVKGKNYYSGSYSTGPIYKEHLMRSDRDLQSRKFGENQRQEPKHPSNLRTVAKTTHPPRFPKMHQDSKSYNVSSPNSMNTREITSEVAKMRNRTWKTQAASAIAREIVRDCCKEYLNNFNFMNFLKTKIKQRIDTMMGKRLVASLSQILMEYKNIFHANTRKSFLNEMINEFKVLRPEQKLGETGVKATGSTKDVEIKGVKRKGIDTLQIYAAKKPNIHTYASVKETIPQRPNSGGRILKSKPLQKNWQPLKQKIEKKSKNCGNEGDDDGKDSIGRQNKNVDVIEVLSDDGEEIIDENMKYIEKTITNTAGNDKIQTKEKSEIDIHFEDIQILTQSIRNDVEKNVEATTGANIEEIDPDLIDIENITQDDLEDF